MTLTLAGKARYAESAEAERCSAAGLSPRETDVLALIAQGLTDRQIADQLKLSRVTVRNYVAFIYTRLTISGGGSRVRAALWFHGLWVPA